MLNLGSNDVLFVGICGIGGIGKTSIATALYNRIFKSFEMSSFLANVREEASRPDGLVSLQQKLIYDIFKKKVEICNSYMGQQLIKEKLRGKNVLLILDDVHSDDQLKRLAIEVNLCGPGSRIIITSRDEHILNLAKVNEIYCPPELDNEQSLRLFSLHAFSRDQPPEDYKQLSHDVLKLAGGLPLTLEVLGSVLFDIRDKKVWENMLNKLQRIPHADVLRKLRISYDNLEEDEKSIFLDVACFFVGWRKDGIISMWEACGFNPISALHKLTQRSLLKFTNAGSYINNRGYSYEVLRMHDQIQAMGRGIVFEESPWEPTKRSRLWSLRPDEILEVLEEQKGTEGIQGILLPPCQMDTNVCLHTKHFAMMSKLRFLNIHGVAHLEGDFQYLPSTLTCFRSTQCPMESGNFYLKKLVYMDLSRSQIRQAWTSKPQNENQRFNKLKFLHLQECRYLNESPNFLWFPYLETLDLSGCFKMVNLHKSIGDLKSLVTLYLDGTKIEELPNNICMLSSLKDLRLNQCLSLKSLPESIGDLKSLVTLYLDGTKIEELPNNICMLSSLEVLSLSQCSSLKSLPESIGDLKSLVTLSLNSTKIEELPNNICMLSSLIDLSLHQCSLKSLPESIGDLKSLVTFYLNGTKIEELPNNICMLSYLKDLSLNQCSSLKSLPESIGGLKSLVTLYLDGTKIEELPNNICMLSSLEVLSLSQCSSIKSLPKSIGDLKSLVKLLLDGTKIEELPNNICMLSSLKDLSLNQCSSLKSLPESIGGLKSLVTLYLDGTKIEELPNNICMLSSLKVLCLNQCSSLKSLPESIGDLKSLVTLYLDGTKIEELPNNICMLCSLNDLSLYQCSSLKSLPESFGDLKSLVMLSLGATKIEELPNNICMLSSLTNLSLKQCSSLKSLPESIGDLTSLVMLYLDGTKIEELPNNICMLSSLEVLSLSQCSSIKSLPKSIGDLKSLVKLLLDGTKIKEFPNSICILSSLKTLNLCGLESLNELPKPISNLESLGELFLSGTHIKELPNDFGCLEKLVELRVKDCHNLVKLPIFEGRPSRLRRINLIGTSVLPSSYDSLVTLHSLEELKIGNKLETSLPPWISGLQPLERLKLRGYTRLESLPDLSSLTNLKELTLRNCEKLNDIGGIKGIKSLKQLYMENCYTITNARRKIFGQGTLLVDDVGLQTSEYSLNVDDGDDGVCKGLILCIVFAFTQPNQEQEEVWQEGELLNDFQFLLGARIHRKHGSYFDCTIWLPMKGVKLTTERDSIYIHHFKGSDLFGIPLEGTNAIEILHFKSIILIGDVGFNEDVNDRYWLHCKVKFWKVLSLKGSEWGEQEIPNKQLDCSEVRRMVADFFKWTSHDEDAGTGSSLSGEDARGEMRKMVVSKSSSDGDDDNESSSYDDCETSSFPDDDDESLYDDCESSFLDDDGSLFALN
ncbi:disease resistance protein RPV1-like [Macadamia integrifolia]|uniref:disease resistance protein RPV1-like n=1 Tax=Macadamia integrifolia TaxID=60698 RepID=UPI001C52C3F2|nr:disease resistance protein RPV1-like [Macadamia integrifolia]